MGHGVTWDYTELATHYSARPNYAAPVLDALVERLGARRPGFSAIDVGAGTGNLTLMLLSRGVHVVAIEPNDAMRAIGEERTRAHGTRWIRSTGETMDVRVGSADWITFGSSFNTMDPDAAVAASHRVLRPGGQMTCMWNHRDLDHPFEREVQSLIRQSLPGYAQGTRRADPSETILRGGLFGPPRFDEASEDHLISPDQYVKAWRSTATLRIQAKDRFEPLLGEIGRMAQEAGPIHMTYTTRAWTARRVDAAPRLHDAMDESHETSASP